MGRGIFNKCPRSLRDRAVRIFVAAEKMSKQKLPSRGRARAEVKNAVDLADKAIGYAIHGECSTARQALKWAVHSLRQAKRYAR